MSNRYERNLAYRASLQMLLVTDWKKYPTIAKSRRNVRNAVTFVGQARSILRTEGRFDVAVKDALELLDFSQRQFRKAGHHDTADTVSGVMAVMSR
jgi:hypothetical protein